MKDSQEILKCPACGEDMEKIFMPEAGINIDVCTAGCGGIYFDNRELENFEGSKESLSQIVEKTTDKTFQTIDPDAVRNCPVCGQKMVKHGSKLNYNVQIDDCYSCGGKFLDKDDLQTILAEFDTQDMQEEKMLDYIYSNIGDDLAKLEVNVSEAYDRKRFLRTNFYKMVRNIVRG